MWTVHDSCVYEVRDKETDAVIVKFLEKNQAMSICENHNRQIDAAANAAKWGKGVKEGTYGKRD